MALACESPEESERPVSHWTARELAAEAVKRGIVSKDFPSKCGTLFKERATLKPHLHRYWLNPKIDDTLKFKEQVKYICQLHQNALKLLEQGIHLVSTDEMTGIQALERLFPTKPGKPKQVEKIEFEYKRHGTLSLIANWDVARGKVIIPSIGATRTERDFYEHIQKTIQTDEKGSWIFIVDRLNTHKSESLVNLVASNCGITTDLGVKGKKGILKSMTSREAFLSDESHRIRFVYVPKHTSWLNQIECWFSILVRRLLKRSSFCSTKNLEQKILNFIDYFNRHFAKPFVWKFEGFKDHD